MASRERGEPALRCEDDDCDERGEGGKGAESD